MRKLKLFFALSTLLLGAGGMQAQTDVTNTYITNPGFEGDYVRFLNINSDRGVEKPVGWSVEWTQSATNDQNGMTYVGSMTQDNKTWSAHGGDKAYFTRMRWANATLNLRQTMVNLRPGSYTLSFYATASKLSNGNGSASVSVAGQSQSITVGTSETTNWTQYTINFTVTALTPYATIEVTAARTAENFKFGIDDFTLTYDGSSYYSTILTAAQTLYDDNADWAENGLSDFTEAITANSGKSTVNDMNAAIVALEEAMATFKEANSVDMTSRITNATFDSNISGWTTTGGDGNAFQRQTSTQTNFNGGFLEKWRNGWNGGYNQKNFDVYQTISSLPNGEYTVKAAIIAVMQGSAETFEAKKTAYSNKKHGGPYYIDDEKGVWLYGTSGENSGKAWANTKNSAFDGDGAEYKTATITVSNGSLTIGFKGIGSESGGTSLGTYANWIACDNWSLKYFGFDPTALQATLNGLKTQASDLLLDDEYTNVIGAERTALTTASTLSPAATKSALESAISQAETAIANFTAAKTNYDALVAMRTTGSAYTTVAWPRASSAKKTALDNAVAAASPTSAADAVTKTNAIVTAYRQFVESNGLAEGVANALDYTSTYLAGADPDVNTGWTNGIGTDWRSQERYTKGDGNQSGRYYDGGWSTSAAVNINMTRELTLPEGQYQLQITARGSSSLTSYTMSIGGETVNLPIDGADEATGTFGHGWSDKFVVFESDGSTPLTLAIVATSTEYQQWISFNRLRLIRLDATLADATDYSNLNDAIDGAEAKTLGFEDDEYAPYANATVLSKLAEAKAINQSANNEQNIVQGLTTYLNNAANWTANDGDVDAIYNGMFDSDVEGDWGLTGWTRTNAWGQQRTEISGDFATAYYNQPGSLKYGNTGVYAMPLAANTAYALTFSYRSHENNSNTGMTISVLNESSEGLAETAFESNGSTSNWKTVTKNFKTGAAGNYVLTLGNGGNTWMTNVSLVKATSESVTVTDAGFATYVSDVDLDFTSTAIKAYKVKVSEKGKATLTKVDKVPAGTPVLLYVDGGKTENIPVIASASAVSGNDLVAGTGAAVATTDGDYTNMILNNVSGIGFYFANGQTVATNRAYLHIDSEYAPAAAGSRMVMVFADETTGVNDVRSKMSEVRGTYYNLNGQRVEKPAKGLYIVNGKKVIIK